MPELSDECKERLRRIEGQLSYMARAADPADDSISEGDLPRSSVETYNYVRNALDNAKDEECAAILRGIEPRIGMIVEKVRFDAMGTSDLLIADARVFLRSALRD